MSRARGGGSAVMPIRNGGWRTYVDAGSQAKRSPAGTSSDRQRSSPSNTERYVLVNMSDLTEAANVASTSERDGQISRRYTSVPSVEVPSGSVVRSMSIVPASA